MNINFQNRPLFLITFSLICLLTYLSLAFDKNIFFRGVINTLEGLVLSFIYIMTSIFMFIILQINQDKVNTRTYRIIAWIFFLYIGMYYAIFTQFSPKITILFHIPFFMPLVVIFIYLIRKTKHFKKYLAMFFAVPFLILTIDFIQTKYFLLTCENITPKAIYNPIYLPDELFHKENSDGKNISTPNIKYINNKNKIKNNDTKNIYMYNNCNDYKRDTTYNVTLFCIKEEKTKTIDTFFYKRHTNKRSIIYINEKGAYINAAKMWNLSAISLIAKYIKGTYSNCILETDNRYSHYKKEDSDYKKFIKPLSEKPETQENNYNLDYYYGLK